MFQSAELLPPDAILGISKAFHEDPRADKIDLGVGVYRTPDGRTPVMKAVAEGEAAMLKAQETKAYTPPEGAPGFPGEILNLIFGEDSEIVSSGRALAVQTPGGCGALRIAGELLNKNGAASILIGDPSWANHFPLLSAAGNTLNRTPYYNKASGEVEFDAFFAAAQKLGPQDVLLLHGCCQNPTGADLSKQQINQLCDLAEERGFLPLIDTAYHGFAQGLEDDSYMMRLFAERLSEVIITYSCSKNFGLYRERTGAIIMIGKNAERANIIRSHALRLARSNYSMPPAHGGAIVAEILASPALREIWRSELMEMAEAVRTNRQLLVERAQSGGLGNRLEFIARQNGMFSLLPITDDQVATLREKHGVYAVGGGRVNMCGVNESNVDHLIQALADVITD